MSATSLRAAAVPKAPAALRPRRRWLPQLRPLPGHRLPRHLRPSQVHKTAERLPGGLADPGFESLMCEISTSMIHRGHRIRLFTVGADSFAAMHEAIRRAEREVLVESFILTDDEVGRALMDDLCEAAGRGVTVRVLADAVGSFGTRSAFWKGLRCRGLEVRLFHPLLQIPKAFFFRDHRKILTVDRRIGFTGGMNIAEEYGSSHPSSGQNAWRDTHVQIEGPAVREMALVFREGWLRTGGERFEIEAGDAGPADGPGILVLESRPNRGHRETASVFAAIAAAARKTLWLTTGYFAPSPRFCKILGRAVQRGVDVRLILPALSDVPVVRHAGHGFFGDLLACGVRVYEYQPSILHAKTLVADGKVAVVGSSNLDFRSFRFNSECNLLFFDPEVAGQLKAALDEDLTHSVEILSEEWHHRGFAHRVGDRLARAVSYFL
jgi:cardiolipin synthase